MARSAREVVAAARWRTRAWPLFAIALLAAAACRAPQREPLLADVPAATSQALVVRASGEVPRAVVTAWCRENGTWQRVFAPMDAVVGRSGIVAADGKREGDGGTPAGVHRIGLAFGYAEHGATKLAYRRATDADWWIDDPDSPSYNRWVTGRPEVSAERMRRDDGLYELGAVLEWNTDPVVPGRGSAIFLHVWRGPGEATAGCIAMARGDVTALLAWLDRTRQPVAVVR